MKNIITVHWKLFKTESKFFDYLFHKQRLLIVAILKRVSTCVPDYYYLKIMYRLLMKKHLDLKHPQTFGEKLQWLKLYNRKSEYVKMVDKYAVKEYVAERIGNEYIIPTLGVWNHAEDIEWDALPNQFVLKCTHNSGGVVICRDKSQIDKDFVVKKLNRGLKQNYYDVWREWPYRNVPRRIIAEKYMTPNNERDLVDYKWYCFNGEPKYCQVIQNRTEQETIDFFDDQWTHQEFIGLNPIAKHANKQPNRPINLEKHICIARDLSKDLPFVRIDLYEIEGQPYFGEMTFYPLSGIGEFNPPQYNDVLGKMIVLPK